MAKIDGETRIVGIVGDPIAQAKSPELFNDLFDRHGVNTILVPLHVPSVSLPSVLDGPGAIRNLAGVVVTVPHKVAAAAFATDCLAEVLNTSAVNCLRREVNGTWTGAMFDGVSFVRGLRAQGRAVRGQRILLVGAGGAGAAVAHALLYAGAASIEISDTSTASVVRLVDALRRRQSRATLAEAVALANPNHDLIINATPCGMQPDDPIPIDLTAAGLHTVVAGLIMKPALTRLLMKATDRGLGIHPGRHLLENSIGAIVHFLHLVPGLDLRENPL
jgi:shikimate dehydrogenase